MQTILSIAGWTLAGIFLLGLLAIIAASYIEGKAKWHFCPKCFQWWSNQGERTTKTPRRGTISGNPKECDQCKP